jgi:curved DNA-binding protein
VYTWTGPGGPGQAAGAPGFDFEDIFSSSPFSGMGLEELLAALGGYSRRGARAAGRSGRSGAFDPLAGTRPDLEYPVTLDFMQAVKGCRTALDLRRRDGTIERIEVKIPPGVRDGSRVRVRGKGAGPDGSGDLFIITRVREHPYFRREGADVYMDLPLSLGEAALGAEVTVPTVDGHASVKVPPGASGGARLRLPGRGVADPRTGRRGDQYLLVKIVLPPVVSEQGLKLLEEFARTDPYDPRKNVPW